MDAAPVPRFNIIIPTRERAADGGRIGGAALAPPPAVARTVVRNLVRRVGRQFR